MLTTIEPLGLETIPAPISNQKSAIYNVHGHFAKRPFNIVNLCIDHYTKKDEIVLDPFSGYGVTAIEALFQARNSLAEPFQASRPVNQ
jgi:DNA modification methylase